MLWRKIDVIKDHAYHIEVDESIKAPKKQQRNSRPIASNASNRPKKTFSRPNNWNRNTNKRK